jgi:imidazoleglycerol phosphate synthase glutamine amidotransferase subunit HisH
VKQPVLVFRNECANPEEGETKEFLMQKYLNFPRFIPQMGWNNLPLEAGFE